MKKVVVANLTLAEGEQLEALERICNTYKTLLLNQFLSDEEKSFVADKFKISFKELNEFYDIILEKYNVPFLPERNFYISLENHELYVNVFD